MIGSYVLHDTINILPPQRYGPFTDRGLRFAFGCSRSFRDDHPNIQRLNPDILSQCTVDGTMSMLVNGGKFQEELSRLAASPGYH